MCVISLLAETGRGSWVPSVARCALAVVGWQWGAGRHLPRALPRAFGGGLGHLPRAIPTPPFREAWAVAREGLIGREATQLGGIPRFIRWNNQINLFEPHTIEICFWG